MTANYIDSIEELKALYAAPSPRAVAKQLGELDAHCRRFIDLSPFVVVATGTAGGFDASPRGGAAGFVRAVSGSLLWIPDSPGNNRVDTLLNIIENPRVGLLFFIPGIDETLRVNGTARLSVDPNALGAFSNESRACKLVIEVSVKEAFLHCAKALMRSRLWSEDARVDRAALPTMGRMLADQTGAIGPVESQEQMIARYQRDL